MSAARTHFIVLAVLITVFTFSTRLRPIYRVGWVLLLLIVGYVVATTPRLQRFTTLSNQEYVGARISTSVNVSILEALKEYPFGNGLGGGGTSIPYFLAGKVDRPIVVESELGRIQLETGIVGVVGWLGFIFWVMMRPRAWPGDPWLVPVRLAWFATAAFCTIGLIGIGLLTAIPCSAMLMMLLGWLGTHHTKSHAPLQVAPAFVPRADVIPPREAVRS